jgi:hypothetical protein
MTLLKFPTRTRTGPAQGNLSSSQHAATSRLVQRLDVIAAERPDDVEAIIWSINIVLRSYEWWE